MKKRNGQLAALLLAIVMILTFSATPIFAAGDQTFKDVPESAWYHGYVEMLFEKGVVKGYGTTGEFRPNNKLIREHASKMVALAAGLPYQGKKADFPDVDKDGEMSPYIAALQDKGAIQGFPDGTFKPKDNIQRGHAAKIVALAFGLLEGDMVQALTDLPQDAGVKAAIEILESNGVVKGYGDTKLFKPEEEISRAEFAKILCIAMVVASIQEAEADPTPENIAAAQALADQLPPGQDGPTQDYLQGRLEELEEEPGGGTVVPPTLQVDAVIITATVVGNPYNPDYSLPNEEGVSVKLTTETEGAEIWYTTDDSTPSASNGTKYSTPFFVEAGTTDAVTRTVKAIAVKVGYSDSAVAILKIKFDAEEAPPVILSATWRDTGSVGTHTIEETAYIFQGFELLDSNNNRIDLVASNIKKMTVLDPGASEVKELTVGDDSDPLMWFNVRKVSGDYKYTVETKAGDLYEATLSWTAPVSVDATKTGEPTKDDRPAAYQLYVVQVAASPGDSSVYRIKPNGEVNKLDLYPDPEGQLNIYFRISDTVNPWQQAEGDHTFLVKKGDVWYKSVITYSEGDFHLFRLNASQLRRTESNKAMDILNEMLTQYFGLNATGDSLTEIVSMFWFGNYHYQNKFTFESIEAVESAVIATTNEYEKIIVTFQGENGYANNGEAVMSYLNLAHKLAKTSSNYNESTWLASEITELSGFSDLITVSQDGTLALEQNLLNAINSVQPNTSIHTIKAFFAKLQEILSQSPPLPPGGGDVGDGG